MVASRKGAMSKDFVERILATEPEPTATRVGGSDPNPLTPDLLCVDFLLRCLSDSLTPSAASQEPADWTAVLALADKHGVTPLLYKRLKEVDAKAWAPAAVWKRLRRTYLVSAARNTRLFRELQTVLQRLRNSGINVIVLKGGYLAEAVYGDVALRPMIDVDLMVRKAQLPRAQAVLLDMIGVQQQPENIESRRKRNAHLPQVVGGDLALEIHWTIAPPAGPARVDAAGLWDRACPANIAGVDVLALSPEDLLLHLCLHASYSESLGAGLRPFCDIAQSIHRFRGEVTPEVRHGTNETPENRRVRSEPRPSSISVFCEAPVVEATSVPGIDWQQVVERSREWGSSRYVSLALQLARSTLGAGVPDDVLEQLVPGGLERRVFEAAKQSVLTRTGYCEWLPFFDAAHATTPTDKARLTWRRIFLSRDEMAEVYPASLRSRLIYFHYARRVGHVVRSYVVHSFLRAHFMISSSERDRNVALVKWLSGKS